MGTLTLLPVATYLNTQYRPDCDFVDGELLERNVGEKPHTRLQRFFVEQFMDAQTLGS